MIRGTQSVPLFIIMTFKDKVQNSLEKTLQGREDLFLIHLSIDQNNKISIILDGDFGVNLQDCIEVSRAIEGNLNRDEQDFSLEVASAGVSSALLSVRQYKKNIGRLLRVKTTTSEEFEGVLTDVDEERIILQWQSREPKKIGKGKETVENSKEFFYQNIKEAVVIISF